MCQSAISRKIKSAWSGKAKGKLSHSPPRPGLKVKMSQQVPLPWGHSGSRTGKTVNYRPQQEESSTGKNPQLHTSSGKVFFLSPAAAAESLQSCPTLCDPREGSPPGSSIPGILQARTLEWVAISFSNAWKWNVKVKSLSCVRLFVTPWTAAYQAPRPWDFPGKSTGVGIYN